MDKNGMGWPCRQLGHKNEFAAHEIDLYPPPIRCLPYHKCPNVLSQLNPSRGGKKAKRVKRKETERMEKGGGGEMASWTV